MSRPIDVLRQYRIESVEAEQADGVRISRLESELASLNKHRSDLRQEIEELDVVIRTLEGK